MFNRKEYAQKRYQEHREEILKQKKEYYKEHNIEIKEYYEKNKEIILKKHKEWKKLNKDKIIEKNKLYKQRNAAQISKKAKEYYKKNKAKLILYNKLKRQLDINFRISDSLRHRIWKALKGICKSKKTLELLGCSVAELKQHLEKKFTEGMSFDNYGKWHIDHIRPCAKFDLSKGEEQKKCFHYTNLQPLWAEENLKKGVK